MVRGGRTALLIGGLALAGCAAPKEVSIRPIADPAARLAAGDLAAARGQLLLGNAGLALEAFRNIHRDRPSDPRALAGIADCYAAMGRFDLAQSNYEAALALAPHDPVLLTGLAAIYQGQGDTIRASALRHEAAAAAAAAAPAPVAVAAAAPARTVAERAIAQPRAASRASPPPTAQIAAAANASTGSITVKLPPPRPVEVSAADVPVEAPPPPVEAQQSQPSSSVTVALPPPQPSSSVTVALPPPRPAPAPTPQQDSAPQVVMAPSTEPRLVRLSRGQVALVTSDRPLWRGQASAPKLASTNVQWIPLRDSTAKPNVQILNAARHQGLAGSARTVLLDRGWRKIAVGDAPATRETSVVYYPRNRSALGRSLAAQFGVRARQIDGDVLVLVLGRDGVNLVGSQRRS
jgi:hypothetical protein